MPNVSCELNVTSHPEGFGWGLWQQQNGKSIIVICVSSIRMWSCSRTPLEENVLLTGHWKQWLYYQGCDWKVRPRLMLRRASFSLSEEVTPLTDTL